MRLEELHCGPAYLIQAAAYCISTGSDGETKSIQKSWFLVREAPAWFGICATETPIQNPLPAGRWGPYLVCQVVEFASFKRLAEPYRANKRAVSL
jgi:hypothetical protein